MKQAMLYEKLQGNNVHCYLCNHHCNISEGKYGICGVRKNIDGTLYSMVYGEIIAAHIDPIEKKPLYHFLPGSNSFSIATIGCNFRCEFCQNWDISQKRKKNGFKTSIYRFSPEDILKEAKRSKCKSISYTYTEPTIFFEFAYDTSKLAKQEGLYNNFVTNGYMTQQAIQTIKPYLDSCNVDLKFFNDKTYKNICKASLSPVLESIKFMKKLDIWIEITTLIVPGLNDTDEELYNISKFIADLDKDIPWHISKFHPDYKYLNSVSTPVETLERAKKIGKQNGLKYIYIGNLITADNNTYCPECGEILIDRGYMNVNSIYLIDGKCPKCNSIIKGIWN